MRSCKYFALLALTAGCMSNRAMVSPYSYAPKSPSSMWMASKKDLDPGIVLEGAAPLTLAEAIDVALRNNPKTKLTWAKARAAAAQYGQSQAGEFPTLKANYAWQRQRSSFASGGQSTVSSGGGTGGGNPSSPVVSTSSTSVLQKFYQSQWGPQVELNYTILDFGQMRATSEAAHQSLIFADYTHNRELQTVISQVTSDYYNFLYQQQLLKANEEDVVTAQITYDAAVFGKDAGVKDVSDVLQAQTQLLQKLMTKVSQTQNVENAYVTLLLDMGLSANQKIALQEFPAIPPIEEMLQSADSLLSMALETRADLLAAEADLRSQTANVSAARRKFLPTLTYIMDFGQTSYTALGSDHYDFTSFLSLNFPIFSGFSDYNALKLAKAHKKQAEATLRQTQLNVVKDVTIAHSTVKTSFETLKYADQFLKAAQEQYDVAYSRYKAGTGSILEVVSAQSSLANARAQQAEATNNWFTSLVQLSYAAGTLEPPKTKEVQ